MHDIELETKDLLIRKAVKSDTESILKNYWSKEKTARFMLWKPTKDFAEAEERMDKTIAFEKDKPCFVITEKSSKEVIGMVGFLETSPGVFEDCGLGIGCDYIGKGYGSQTLKRMLDYLFIDCNAKKIIYTSMQENIKSISLQQKYGFKYVNSIEKVRQHDNYPYTINVYELIKENYFNNKN